jgi:hypothetical protein
LESLNDKIDSLSSALKNQLSFNTMIETQLAQFVALVSSAEDGKISEQLCSDLGPFAPLVRVCFGDK